MTDARPLPEDTPSRVGPFDLLEVIATGRHGRLYRARHTGSGALVALKRAGDGVDLGPDETTDYVNAAKTASRLSHPGILCRSALRQDEGGVWFYTTPFVAGATLQQRLETGPLEVEEAVRMILAVASALGHAHQRGYVHLNVGPGNILLGEDGRVLLRKFGLAVSPESARLEAEASDAAAGRLYAYLAPEQIRGRASLVGRPADVYGLGAVLYAALTGRPPHVAANLPDLEYAILSTEPLPPSLRNDAVSQELDTVVERCLEHARLWRYQNGVEIHADLERVQAGGAPAPLERGIGDRLRRYAERKEPLVRRIAAALALLVVFGVPGGLLLLDPPDPGVLLPLGAELTMRNRVEKDPKRRARRRSRHEPKLKEPTFSSAALRMERRLESAKEAGRFRWVTHEYLTFEDGKVPDAFTARITDAESLLTPSRTLLSVASFKPDLLKVEDGMLTFEAILGSRNQRPVHSYLAAHWTEPIAEDFAVEVVGVDRGGSGPCITLCGDGFDGYRFIQAWHHQQIELDTIAGYEHRVFQGSPHIFPREQTRYRLRVEKAGKLFRAFVDGKRELLWLEDRERFGETRQTFALTKFMGYAYVEEVKIYRGVGSF
jgi:hypothetical protein